MVYSKDFDSAKDRQRQAENQGGRFASAEKNIRNKARTAQLEGRSTFEVLDSHGNTIRYNTPKEASRLSQSQINRLSDTEKAKVAMRRNTHLQNQLKQKANRQAIQIDNTRTLIEQHKAIAESRKNTKSIKSKVDSTRAKIAELERVQEFYNSSAGQAQEKRRYSSLSRSQKRKYRPSSFGVSKSLASEKSKLSSLESSLGQSTIQQTKIKKSASVFVKKKSNVTVQRSGPVQVHKLRLYQDDTRSVKEQMRNPVTTTQGPYIETQEDADVINKNRKKIQDDKDRSKLRTLSDNEIVKAIPFLQKPAKAFDEYFETAKLPKERNVDDSKMFQGGKPNNQFLTGFVSPVSNIIADVDDLGKATSDYIRSGGKEGFVKEDTPFGKVGGYVPKQYNPKTETALGKTLKGEKVDLKDPLMRGSVYGDVAIFGGAVAYGLSTGKSVKSSDPLPGYKNLKPIEFGKTVFTKKSLGEQMKTAVKGKTPLEKSIEQSIKDSRVRYQKLTPDQKISNPLTRAKTLQKLKTDDIRYFDTRSLGLKNLGKFTSKEKSLGVGIGAIIPKGQSKPPVPSKSSGSFDIVGLNKKGGTVSKPFFEEPKAPTKGNQILKDAAKSEQAITKELQNSYQQKQSGRQSNAMDNLFKKPKKQKSKKSDTEFQYDYSQLVKTKSKPGLKTSVFPKYGTMPILAVSTGLKSKSDLGFIVKTATPQKQKSREKYDAVFAPVFSTKQTPQLTPEIFTPQTPFVPPVPRITHIPPEIPTRFPTGGFLPYVPKISLSSWGFGKPGAVKDAFAAYGISSDINIKTLPTYSRFGKSTNVFAAQMKEDKKIQDLFYGKKTKGKSKSKGKGKSKSSSKKSNTRKKKKK